MNGFFGDMFDLDRSGSLDFAEQTLEFMFIDVLEKEERRWETETDDDDVSFFA